jgi:hypothetical protein
MEAALINGATVDVGKYSKLASTLVRLSKKIGLDRIPKDVTPTLAQFIDNLPDDADADAADVEYQEEPP